MTPVKATLKGQFMVTALRESQLPRFKNLPVNEPSKNHLAGWFFRISGVRLRS